MKILAGFLALALTAVAATRADIVATRTLIHTGQVTRVAADGITVKIPMGDITIPVSEVVAVDVAQPAALAAAGTAVRARNYPEAIQTLKPVVDQLAGLPVPWMEDAILLLGDAYAGIPEATNAKKFYDLFKQLYPTSPKVALVDGKFAKILVEQKQYGKALPLLENFVNPLLAKSAISDVEEQAVAESLLLLGDCQRETGKLEPALDSYLTIATLFDVDAFLTVQARQRSAQIFEQQQKWKRARQSYEEMFAHGPPPALAEEARQKLAALNEAHPE